MKKIKLPTINISLRLFITIAVTALCGIILLVYTAVFTKLNKDKHRDEMVNRITKQCDILSDSLISNEFSLETPLNIENTIDNISNTFQGRVLVINKDYRIIKDTFGDSQHSFIVNQDVIQVMTGKKQSITTDKDSYIQHITAVVDEGEILGVIMINASTEYTDELFSLSRGGNISIICLVLFISIVAAFLIGFFSVRGIERINKQIESTPLGHLDEPLPVKGFKEFRTLTSSYNTTMSKLVSMDSTRQEFVSNVSHELKTPITSMKVLADSLVQNQDADLDMYKEFMSDIIEEIDRESEIINDLLTLVKTDRKDAEMNISEVNINNLLEVILKRVNPIAASRGIDISYESYREIVANVDEVKLSLALTNIIENAVKYNVDNGWVKVTLNADHKNFHVKVADSGVGIPDDCKEQVFERFYRVDKARSRDTGGTGLGLAITKNVIRMHKGTIKLYSESGEGTTFTIKIPIKYTES